MCGKNNTPQRNKALSATFLQLKSPKPQNETLSERNGAFEVKNLRSVAALLDLSKPLPPPPPPHNEITLSLVWALKLILMSLDEEERA